MVATWKQYEGQAVDGIPLLRLLGGSEAGAVFLGELGGEKCAIKLVPSDEAVAQIPLARWQQASKLSHPHLTRIHQWGRARLGDRALVYLVMEYAEEDLAGVGRPLTPKEAREMLEPTVQALAYLHGQKFAHGRIKPSNILSVNDVLKISGDAPLRIGERYAAGKSACDPPELATSGVTPAGDVWSLGVALVEALTKELPVSESDPAGLPESLKPDSFREVAAGCLQRDPTRRWTIADITQWLERGTVPAPKPVRRRYLVPVAAAAAVVAAGGAVWAHFSGSAEPSAAAPAPVTVAPPATTSQQPVAQPTALTGKTPAVPAQAVSKSDPSPAPPPRQVAKSPETKPTEPKPREPKPAPVEVAQDKAPQEAAPAAAGDAIPSEVVQPVKPDVPAKSRSTVHGKVPISVRVEVGPTGTVTSAKVESGESSKYFADFALKAAQQWKFAPSQGGSVWLVRFEFTRNPQVSTQATKIR